MTAIGQLRASGFIISKDLEQIVKKLPPFEIVGVEVKNSRRVAGIYVDRQTEIIIQQNISNE